VLTTNTGMLQVFKKGAYPFTSRLSAGVYQLTIPFTDLVKQGNGIR
jgi:hypothetical protein